MYAILNKLAYKCCAINELQLFTVDPRVVITPLSFDTYVGRSYYADAGTCTGVPR